MVSHDIQINPASFSTVEDEDEKFLCEAAKGGGLGDTENRTR